MRLRHCTALVAFASLAGCSATTLLSASFRDDSIGTPPKPQQTVGTVNYDNGDGSVLVVSSPSGNGEKFVQIKHNDLNGNQTGMQGVFAQREGNGTFALLAVMYIPSGAGAATLAFEPFSSGPHDYVNFLHLDFMPDNTVRIDDGAVTFGKFPRDQFFTILGGSDHWRRGDHGAFPFIRHWRVGRHHVHTSFGQRQHCARLQRRPLLDGRQLHRLLRRRRHRAHLALSAYRWARNRSTTGQTSAGCSA